MLPEGALEREARDFTMTDVKEITTGSEGRERCSGSQITVSFWPLRAVGVAAPPRLLSRGDGFNRVETEFLGDLDVKIRHYPYALMHSARISCITVQAIFLHNFAVLVVCTHSAFLRCVHQEMGSSMNYHGQNFFSVLTLWTVFVSGDVATRSIVNAHSSSGCTPHSFTLF